MRQQSPASMRRSSARSGVRRATTRRAAPVPTPAQPTGALIARHELNAWTPELGRFIEHIGDVPTRYVGWGTGSAFEYFHARHPLQLAYSVDNEPAKWGTTRSGVPIFGPDMLRSEDPQHTLVVIYSMAWREILPQLSRMGFERAVPAGALFGLLADPAGRARLERADTLARQRVTRRPSGSRAIVVQGPIVPEVTRYSMSVTSAQHPRDLIVLSTWKETPEHLIADLTPYVDEIVLNDAPAVHGIQHRNSQIVSTRAGLECARAAGAKEVLKTRTDGVHIAPDLFDHAAALAARFVPSAARAAGLRGRIIVPQSFTRMYVPYHASDLMMLGAIEDLLAFWSAPLDLRPGMPADFYPPTASLRDLALDGRTPECYFGVHYCRHLGRRIGGTVHDSWAYYRDLFTVVDNDWFGLLWLKNVSMPEARLKSGPRRLVDHRFWKRLVSGRTDLRSIVPQIDPHQTHFQDFYEALP
jgi:hypothetical protein